MDRTMPSSEDKKIFRAIQKYGTIFLHRVIITKTGRPLRMRLPETGISGKVFKAIQLPDEHRILRTLTSLHRSNPKNYYVNLALAEFHHRMADTLIKWDESILFFKQAIRARPDCDTARLGLAIVLSNSAGSGTPDEIMQKFSEALYHFSRLIENEPDAPIHWYNLAFCYLQNDHAKLAAELFKLNISKFPEYPDNYLGLYDYYSLSERSDRYFISKKNKQLMKKYARLYKKYGGEKEMPL
ncbi:MAG: tetratricopeptide repeat protein [Leptonema illini]|uniref:Tetratricopeptide repeat protein n=1 Tax=Leptonema illini TaxID=183 RepID=A0A833LX44_9LEPT|nr:MAG: tetratricopeptide repeat protein [Leptonema illini]